MSNRKSDDSTVAHIAEAIRAALTADRHVDLANEIALAAQVIAKLRPEQRGPAQVDAILNIARLAPLRIALAGQSLQIDQGQKTIDFSGAQTGDVSLRDVAGGNITTINVWNWERFGEAVPTWLARQLDQCEREKSDEERLAEADLERLKYEERQRWLRMDWKRTAQSYRKKVTELYGTMQIFGMSRPMPLANIFTDVYLLDKPSALRRHTIEELKSRPLMHADPLNTEQRWKGGSLVNQYKQLFILGQPGAGKTTFLKHLVIQAVQGNLESIPIFVPLKAWSDTDLDLMAFIVRQFEICSFPNAQAFIETILTEGRAIILFDGLDEVNHENKQHQRITQNIRDFAYQYSESYTVITCRTAATDYTFEKFTYCEIADFTQIEIEAFVNRWFHQDDVKRSSFLNALTQPEHERLRDLARRPLLLTMLCLTFDETMAFPQRRAELYEEAIDALMKKWDSSRSIQRDQIYRNLSLGYKRQLLAELAAETFDRNEFFISKAWLVERIVRFLRRLPRAQQDEDIDGEVVLASIEAQHGLLIERARNIYSFSHLTFHEYFTARYIADHPDSYVFRAAISQGSNPQWREILLLATSMLDYRNVTMLFQIWCQRLQELLKINPPLGELLDWVKIQEVKIAIPNVIVRANVLATLLIDQALYTIRVLITFLESQGLDASSPYYIGNSTLAKAKDLANYLTNTRNHSSALDLNIVIGNIKDIRDFLDKTKGINFEFAEMMSKVTEFRVEKAGIVHAILSKLKFTTTIEHLEELEHIPLLERQITDDQLQTLGDYLKSTSLLLDCLDLAAIEDRQAVLDQLLIPPEI